MGGGGELTMPEETPYRWLNREGRWPGATAHGLHRDGEHWTLPVVTLPVGEPWVTFPFEPEGAAVELRPLTDGAVTVVDRARARVVRVSGDGVAEAPEGAVVPPAQPEDAAVTAARARVNGVAAAPAPDGWGSDFLVVTLAGAVFLVPADPLEPERRLADVAAGLAGVAVDHHGLPLLAGPAGLYRPSAPQRTGRGVLVAPAPHPGTRPRWDRVQIELAEPAPAGTHARIWTLASRTPHGPDAAAPAPPAPTARDQADTDHAPVPTAAGRWRAGPLDCPDVRVLNVARETAPALWVAVELVGDGQASPRLGDIRVACSGRGLLDQLPTVYTGRDDGSGRLGRLLGLFTAVYGEVAGDLDRSTRLLDPAAAPDRPDAPWLTRLATWVDAYPPPPDAARQQADSRRLRERVAGAFAAHARRGTPAGLVEAVRRETGGVEVELHEPLLDTGVWRLGDKRVSTLGTTTRLGARPDPPVLDGTAVLDDSWLIQEEDRGLPLYAESAHRVQVLVPAEHAQLLAAVRRVVERERPAHVVAEVRLKPAPPP
ncbi:phage tail protein [Streptomyces sp. NPDC000410]|uniref:phage tail protein n=1 Tax=Streptomyces sp. NPDC000410 TaxID=3154254 RepID=UPI00332C04ED